MDIFNVAGLEAMPEVPVIPKPTAEESAFHSKAKADSSLRSE
jgi:hypothetical protein